MEIRELRSDESELIHQVEWIYEQSFPVEERDPFEHILQAIRRREAGGAEECEHCHFQVAVEGHQALAAAFFNYYPRTRMGFIAYLAVHPTRRSLGLGAQLYRRVVESVQQEAHSAGETKAVGVVFEVEAPELSRDEGEQSLRRRRIAFYQRSGAMLLPGLDLIAPPLGHGLPEMPYKIMFHPLAGARLPLERRDLEDIVETVLGCSYGLPSDSPYYRRTLASIRC